MTLLHKQQQIIILRQNGVYTKVFMIYSCCKKQKIIFTVLLLFNNIFYINTIYHRTSLCTQSQVKCVLLFLNFVVIRFLPP